MRDRALDGSQVDRSARVADPEGKGLGVAFADFDDDGWTDIFQANDNARQFLFRNRGDGTFEDVALLAGVGYDENGKAFAGMGVDAADYDNDGRPDVFVTALSNETYPLFRNNGDLSFSYATGATGLGPVTIPYTGWGARLADFDAEVATAVPGSGLRESGGRRGADATCGAGQNDACVGQVHAATLESDVTAASARGSARNTSP